MKKSGTGLEGKTVLITGASSGLGEQLAKDCAKKKMHLILCARRVERLEEVATFCRKETTYGVDVVELDVTDNQSIKHLIEYLRKRNIVIDVLINNAGLGIFKTFIDLSQDEIEQQFSVNVLGLIELTKHIVPMMVENKQGHVINIASQAGKIATPKSSVYSATKFSVIGFSNALRLEMKSHNVYVTTVNPGPMKTEFFDQADPTGDYLSRVGGFALSVETLSTKIVHSILKPKREINAPFLMNIGSIGYHVFPKMGDYLALNVFNKK